MKCFAPEELEDGDYFSYLEGEATFAVKRHIESCPACLQEVARLEAMDNLITAGQYRDSCPEAVELLAFGTGMLTAVEQQTVKAHLQVCQFCQADLAMMELEKQTSLSSLSAQIGELSEKVKKAITAVPVKMPAQPTFALRGDGRQNRDVYQAGDYQIIVVKMPLPALQNAWQIQGQILKSNVPAVQINGNIELIQNDDVVNQTNMNQFGNFSLNDQINEGVYTLKITFQNEIINIPNYTVP